MKPQLLVQGMHGLGDCLHQRAVLRQLMQKYVVWLETSWASMYHDLVGPDLKLVRKASGLRTQSKNAARENALFTDRPPHGMKTLRIGYGGEQVMRTESQTVLEGMCQVTNTSFPDADYTLPVPQQWFEQWEPSSAFDRWQETGKPLMVYRPLVARPEWRGSVVRNADPASYAKLLAEIRNDFFVISVADLMPGREWIVGPRLIADVEFHDGQLTFETMAALFASADLVFTSGGFASILAPAVRTPCVSVIGGYEHAGAHDTGKRFAPMLSLGPEKPCKCWSSQCHVQCNKALDMSTAIPALHEFLSEIRIQTSDSPAKVEDIFTAEQPVPGPLATPFGPPRNHPGYQLYLQQQRALAFKAAEKGRA